MLNAVDNLKRQRDSIDATNDETTEYVELERLRKKLDLRLKEIINTKPEWSGKHDAEPWLLNKEGNLKTDMSTDMSMGNFRERASVPKKGFNTKNALGKYVYHMTSYRNLVFRPDSNTPFTGILSTGLDPSKGGGKGGACELCTDETLKETSEKHSKNKICTTANRLAMRTYVNQRENYAEKQKSTSTDESVEGALIDNFSILLRFAIEQSHIEKWQADPVVSSGFRGSSAIMFGIIADDD
jgi:hypothetical protein